MVINNVQLADAGTYICAASYGDVTGVAQIALMVRRRELPLRFHYPVNTTNLVEMQIHDRHGGDFPNYPYQADAPALNNSGSPGGGQPNKFPTVSQKISPVLPGHPRAVVEPSEVAAKPGDTVILRCNATGEEPLKFYWKADFNDYIPVHVRVAHGALIFRSIRTSDFGVYFCIAWNHLGQSTARATVKLDNSIGKIIPPSGNTNAGPLTVEVLHPEITARVGENVNFQCRSNFTGVKYQWSRIGEKMPNSSDISQDGLLTLYRVSEANAGIYLCTVVSPLGEKTTAQAELKVRQVRDHSIVLFIKYRIHLQT